MVDLDPNRRMVGAEAFAASYEQTPPWETGRPQTAILEAMDRGLLTGHVLDVGCGTGEHALLAVERGLTATGVDIVPRAIELAQQKAAARGLDARFVVGDATDLESLGETFDTVVDCGLFHTLDDAARAGYLRSLSHVVVAGGRVVVLCFSDQVPGDAGPRRIAQAELRASFHGEWDVEEVLDASIDVAFGPVDSVHAWRASVRRR